jgi:hypothetical protein
MKPVGEQINPKLVKQATILAQYTQMLRNVLPVECHNHVEVANIRQQILMLITDSPVWTTRLRQLSPRILQYFNENRTSETATLIHHIQISTRYQKKSTRKENSASESHRHKPVISSKTAEILSQSAETIEHKELKDSLLKLASHGNSQKNKQLKPK